MANRVTIRYGANRVSFGAERSQTRVGNDLCFVICAGTAQRGRHLTRVITLIVLIVDYIGEPFSPSDTRHFLMGPWAEKVTESHYIHTPLMQPALQVTGNTEIRSTRGNIAPLGV